LNLHIIKTVHFEGKYGYKKFGKDQRVWWHDATLFVYFSYFYDRHFFNYIHSTHLSVAIRRGLSPSPHRFEAQWESLPVVPSRELNLGLPNSKPTLYQLSNAAL
jgi:hypothetical protein